MIIKGNRINLRKLKQSDAKSIYKHVNDLEIIRYTLMPWPYKKKDAESFIPYTHSQMKKKEAYELGIEWKETGEVIGMIGLMKIDLENKKAEIGYWLGKEYWRKGIMSEAGAMMLRFGFKELKLHRVYAKIFHPNKPSAKFLESLGFQYEGRLRQSIKRRGKWMDDLVYGLLEGEFNK